MNKFTGPGHVIAVRLTVLWQCLLLACIGWVPDAKAEDSARNHSSGQRSTIGAGCEPRKDPTDRYIVRNPDCLDVKTDAAASVRPKIAKPISAAARVPDPIQIDEPLVDHRANASKLKVDAVGVGLGLTAGGLLYWYLCSNWMAALLLLGLPIWRHLDLLPIVAPAEDRDDNESPAAPVVAGESVFSSEPDENESRLDVPRVKG